LIRESKKDREKTERSGRGKGGEKNWPNRANRWSTETRTLEFAPTIGPIHVAKDISVKGNSFETATTSQVTHRFSEVSVPEAFLRR
jgi:hypothetical protein